MGIIIKARNVPINHLFRDPANGELFIMRAFDSKEGVCLAEKSDGHFCDCPGDYAVRLEPHPVKKKVGK